MICVECKGKMKCTYSVPTVQNTRYRIYVCAPCKREMRTFEIDVMMIENPKIKAILNHAEENRLKLLWGLKGEG